MALRDFFSERRLVVHAGRRYVCRKPTVETVVLFLSAFASEIQTCAAAFEKTQNKPADPAPVFLRVFTAQPAKLATVLDTCCELWRGAPGEFVDRVDDTLAEALCSALLSLCDTRRIVASLALDALNRPTEDSTGPTDQERAICAVAERYGCTPMDVCRWPYEAYLTAIEVVAQPRRETPTEYYTGGIAGLEMVKA